MSGAADSEGTFGRDLATQECVESQAGPFFPAMPVMGCTEIEKSYLVNRLPEEHY